MGALGTLMAVRISTTVPVVRDTAQGVGRAARTLTRPLDPPQGSLVHGDDEFAVSRVVIGFQFGECSDVVGEGCGAGDWYDQIASSGVGDRPEIVGVRAAHEGGVGAWGQASQEFAGGRDDVEDSAARFEEGTRCGDG